MLKAALLLAGPSLLLSAAALALGQDEDPEQYWAVGDGPPWYLQRSTCTLARNDDSAGTTIWLRINMGLDIEFADRSLGAVNDEPVELVVTLDGTPQESFTGFGAAFDDGRRGYRVTTEPEVILGIGAGRRLEIRRGEEAVLRLDPAGAGAAVAAMRDCHLEAAAEAMESGNGVVPLGEAADWNRM